MRKSPYVWAFAGAAVALSLVVADASTAADHAAVPQDVALTSAEGAADAATGPLRDPGGGGAAASPSQQARDADRTTAGRRQAGLTVTIRGNGALPGDAYDVLPGDGPGLPEFGAVPLTG
ncbi:hypothetical protein FZ103_01205 [Streptomonospora sp. PA3]|uniref:hypothetical protein n=1 Tax=Streptomonospora sp. PA3 TaxID=2607326 RepID=UPI0012DFABBD|nr:hypothetical protein [Streptomonospora sp. PA3]MUL39808.1 hypothetical protein [Streptomonospora sp. PA3]